MKMPRVKTGRGLIVPVLVPAAPTRQDQPGRAVNHDLLALNLGYCPHPITVYTQGQIDGSIYSY